MFPEEIEKRKGGKFEYDLSLLNVIKEMNDSLQPLESKLLLENIDEIHPNIFILGLPRSGTTLLSQLLFNNLDLACTNNLIARFWDAPLCGCYLSKAVIGNARAQSYDSLYGKTNNIECPHEFGNFWNKHLLIENFQDLYSEDISKKIDWEKLQMVILNMNRIFGKGLVYKTLEITARHFRKFHDIFSRSLYIYIHREPIDIAVSIAKARLDYYNNINTWWSSIPAEYAELEDKPYWEQIAGQIYYLRNLHDTNILPVKTERVIHVNYEDVCNNPTALLDQVIAKSTKLFDYPIKKLNTPLPLSPTKPMVDKQYENKLREGLAHFNLL